MSNDRPTRILLVPGLGGSGAGHWQTNWAGSRAHARTVRQTSWDAPTVTGWVDGIDAAIDATDGPVVLVAHSLGCAAVAHWSTRVPDTSRIAGALLVAPCDVERPGVCAAIRGFAPIPAAALPFRSTVVASRDDPYAAFSRLECFATRWGSAFVDAGKCGHINAASDLRDWAFGQVLLDDLLAAARDDRHVRAAALRRDMSPPAPCFGI